MPQTMNAWVLHGAQDIRYQKVPRPEPATGQVLIHVRAAGICGSDIHYHAHGRIGHFVPSRPFILGHEFSGDVAALGPGVESLQVGDRVAVDPSRPCLTCDLCRRGHYNLCPDMVYFGSAAVDPPADGCFADYVLAPARNCHALPIDFAYAWGALLEPLSVAAHALERSGGVAGRSVLITGAGTIGQLILMLTRAFGASPIVVSDPRPFARSFALAHGADHALDPVTADSAGHPAHPATSHPASNDIANRQFDRIFEASGTAGGLNQAIQRAARAATVVQVGTVDDGTAIPANAILTREINYVGSWRFSNVFGRVLGLISSGRIDPRPVLSRTFAFHELQEALAVAGAGHEVIKVQLAR